MVTGCPQTVDKAPNRQNEVSHFSAPRWLRLFGYLDLSNTKAIKKSCFASILTYFATHTLPYFCTPTSVSCLSLEPFSTVCQAVDKALNRQNKGMLSFVVILRSEVTKNLFAFDNARILR